MFSDCIQLISLNLSHFNTSNVENLNCMFCDSTSISFLILSNFDTSKVIYTGLLFGNCPKLEYINIKNFIENDNLTIPNMFFNVPDNIVVCLDESSNKIRKEIMNRNCYTFDCSDNWKIIQKKRINKADLCYDIFSSSIFDNCEYKGLYYENNIKGNLTNNSTINYCKCHNENCNSCSDISFIDYNLYEIEDANNSN